MTDIEPVLGPRDIAPLDELRAPRERQEPATHPDGSPVLLDILVAYDREAARMKAAGPRRRMTADDLDKL